MNIRTTFRTLIIVAELEELLFAPGVGRVYSEQNGEGCGRILQSQHGNPHRPNRRRQHHGNPCPSRSCNSRG